MKITKKKLLLPISIVATALVTGGVAYAVTSSNFSKQATLWATKNCTTALSTSAATATNEQKSIICYNYNKNNEQDTSINNLGSKSGLVYVDGNNNVLGSVIQPIDGDNISFLDINLNRTFTVNSHTGDIYDSLGFSGNVGWVTGPPIQTAISKYYESSGCTGDAYTMFENGAGNFVGGGFRSKIFKANDGYYIVSDADYIAPTGTRSPIRYIASTMSSDGVCSNFNDNPDGMTLTGYYRLTPVTLDFKLPIKLPISIK